MAVPVLRDVGETAIPRLDELSIDGIVPGAPNSGYTP